MVWIIITAINSDSDNISSWYFGFFTLPWKENN